MSYKQDLQLLTKLLPPPIHNPVSKDDFTNSSLGRRAKLPGDYLAFIEMYDSGRIATDYPVFQILDLRVRPPLNSKVELILDAKRGHYEESPTTQLPAFPAQNRILPWASYDGVDFYLQEEVAERWNFLIDWRDRIELYDLNIVSFLVLSLQGKGPFPPLSGSFEFFFVPEVSVADWIKARARSRTQ